MGFGPITASVLERARGGDVRTRVPVVTATVVDRAAAGHPGRAGEDRPARRPRRRAAGRGGPGRRPRPARHPRLRGPRLGAAQASASTIGPLPSHPQGENTLWQVRFPRVVMAAARRRRLATAGALMQGVFGNPLAEPGVVGVSAGAAVARGLRDRVLLDVRGHLDGRALRVRRRAAHHRARLRDVARRRPHRGRHARAHRHRGQRRRGRRAGLPDVPRRHPGPRGDRLLAARQPQRLPVGVRRGGRADGRGRPRRGAAWSRDASTCSRSAIGPPATSASTSSGCGCGCIVVVALLTAAAVAFCGIISFVGLVVPHLIRLLAGPGHRLLVPASALGGAVLLVLRRPVGPDRWSPTPTCRSACSPPWSADRSSSG